MTSLERQAAVDALALGVFTKQITLAQGVEALSKLRDMENIVGEDVERVVAEIKKKDAQRCFVQ